MTAAGELYTFGWNVLTRPTNVDTAGRESETGAEAETGGQGEGGQDVCHDSATDEAAERIWWPQVVRLGDYGRGSDEDSDGCDDTVALPETLSSGGWHACIGFRHEI